MKKDIKCYNEEKYRIGLLLNNRTIIDVYLVNHAQKNNNRRFCMLGNESYEKTLKKVVIKVLQYT